MKTLMAITQAILTFIGAAFIGLVFYSELSNPYNYISAAICLIIAIYLSARVFKLISRRGYIATITGDNATYELDNLKPVPGSGITELNGVQLVNHFEQQSLDFPPYAVTIWGDTNTLYLKEKRSISTISYDDTTKVLFVGFEDDTDLRIKHPAIIHHASSYIKIIKAQEVVWRVKDDDLIHEFLYINNGSKIITKSNRDWNPKREDLGIGMNAIYLQG